MLNPLFDPSVRRAIADAQRFVAEHRHAIVEAQRIVAERRRALVDAQRFAAEHGHAIVEAQRIVAEHRLALVDAELAIDEQYQRRSGDLPWWVDEAPEPVFRAWLEGNL